MNFSFKKMSILFILVGLSFLLQLSACRKDKTPEANDYKFIVPEGWPQPNYAFENNEVSKSKFLLGKELFYDVQLSINNTVSCGTCHQAFSAFAQLDHDVSHGIFDRVGKRNSPPLFNMNWNPTFFWDGRVNHLELQPLNPIADTTEMGETLEGVITKLQADVKYDKLFTDAFGSNEITSQKLLKSLAVFMGLMISNNAKYDKVQRGEASYTLEEERGLQVFNNNCATCHTAPLFSDFSFRSNGLPLQANAHGTIDSGKASVAPFDPDNMYKFKVPSLRNLKYTRPYMHDGRFATLDQVLNHYASLPGSNTTNLDPLLNNGIQLSAAQKTDLLAFLNTLNDESFTKDKRFIEGN